MKHWVNVKKKEKRRNITKTKNKAILYRIKKLSILSKGLMNSMNNSKWMKKWNNLLSLKLKNTRKCLKKKLKKNRKCLRNLNKYYIIFNLYRRNNPGNKKKWLERKRKRLLFCSWTSKLRKNIRKNRFKRIRLKRNSKRNSRKNKIEWEKTKIKRNSCNNRKNNMKQKLRNKNYSYRRNNN